MASGMDVTGPHEPFLVNCFVGIIQSNKSQKVLRRCGIVDDFCWTVLLKVRHFLGMQFGLWISAANRLDVSPLQEAVRGETDGAGQLSE